MDHWIKKCQNSSWGALCEALMIIGENVIAKRIGDKYIQSYTTPENRLLALSLEHSNSRSEKKSAPSGTPAVLMPGQSTATSTFAIVMDKTTEILETIVKPESLLQFLRFYCHPQNAEMLYIDEDVLQGIGSVSGVMKSLVPKYLNYRETEILKAIIERFKCNEAQSLLQHYHDQFQNNMRDESLDLTRRKRQREKCDGHFDSASTVGLKKRQRSTEDACIIHSYFDTYIERRVNQFNSKEKGHLKDLLKRIPKLVLQDICLDSFLWQLAAHITDWRELAPQFGISECGVRELVDCYPDVHERNYRALICWKQINPATARYENLITCLLAHAPFDLVDAALTMLILGMQNVTRLGWGCYLIL